MDWSPMLLHFLLLYHSPIWSQFRSHIFSLPSFHCAVHGVEYAFGAHDYPTSGVFEVEPRQCPGFKFRKSIFIGTTCLDPIQVWEFMERHAARYHGDTYHLIVKNCNHFCKDVCYKLTGKSIPKWVNRLAKIGTFSLNHLSRRGFRNYCMKSLTETSRFMQLKISNLKYFWPCWNINCLCLQVGEKRDEVSIIYFGFLVSTIEPKMLRAPSFFLFFCQTVHPLQPSASITSVRDSPYCKCHKKMTCRLPTPGQNNFYGIHSFLGQTGRGSMVSVVSGKNVPPPWNYFSGHGLCILQL